MASHRLTLSLLPSTFAVVRLDAADPWPAWALDASDLVALTRTADELSVICREDAVPAGVTSQGGWRALKVHGPFPFDTVGVLAALSGALAEAAVSLLAVSTFETDYLLVPGERLDEAVAALAARHHVM